MNSLRNGNQTTHNRYYGKYRGTVTNTNDPQKIGRIRARVPDVLGDLETGWAMPCLPLAGNCMGQFTIPSPEAGVWIEFESGDVSRPIWTGCWWGANQLPQTESGNAASPSIKILQSENGYMLVFDDKKATITLSDSDGSNMVKIITQEGKIKIQANAKVVIEAPLIEHVENATHPLVFGDQLLQYLNQLVLLFNSHVHPGELALGFMPVTPAPPQAVFQPPTPDLLSQKVKTG